MTNLKIYSVFDTKSKLYSMPHFQPSDGVAIRDFSTACQDEKTKLNQYPSDFSLYAVGKFNVETGEIEACNPEQLCNAAEFIQNTDSE